MSPNATKGRQDLNEDKSRIVNLGRSESFSFLGFDIRCIRSRNGKWRPHCSPKIKKRTTLLRKLSDIFRRWKSQPAERIIAIINPILRGWVNYFSVGNSGRCFNYIRDWVERKLRRHLMRARQRQGFGWKRWSDAHIYATLGLFDEYQVVYYRDRMAVNPSR